MSDATPIDGSHRSSASTPPSAPRALDANGTVTFTGPPVSVGTISKDERIAYLTKKVSELEQVLRDSKLEIRSLRLENRTLADQLAARNPALYSTSVVMDWIDEDILPMQAYTPIDSNTTNTKSEPGSTRRSRSTAVTSTATDANRSPVVSSRKANTSRGSRNSPPLLSVSGPSPHSASSTSDAVINSTSTITRPSSSLGRHVSNSTSTTTTTSGRGPIKRTSITCDMQLDSQGMPITPVVVGPVTLISLGSVVAEEGYSNERNVFPVGYTVQREFMSCTKKDSTTTYTCSILRGPRGPLFRITAADQPNVPQTGTSATEVWTQITKAANQLCGRHITTKISGPEYYGLNHPLIVSWIQKLPGIEDLTTYRIQDIVVVDDRETKSSKTGVKRGLELSDEDDVLMDES